MACTTFCLRTEGTTGADPGGTWTNPGGTYSGTLTGDDPCVDPALMSPGANVFEYCVLDCNGDPQCTQVTYYLMDIGTVSGTQAISLCPSDPPVDLTTLLTINVGPDGTGAWSGDISNPGWTEPIFDPGASGTGTFTYTYTITPNIPAGHTDLGCCDPVSATITITVDPGANPGTGGQFAGC